MKANIAFMYGPHDLRIENVELPELRPDQILIKLKACGICGSDVECFEGESAEGRYDIAPYTPGHEWAGQAVAVGSEVTSIKVGNKVVGDCVLACGKCANCKEGKMPSACLNMREIGFRPDSPGGFGEYMILEEQYTHVIPDDWDYELGAWVETFNVGYWGVWGNGCAPDASDEVAIIGGGPIGLSAAMVAKTAGAKVILIDPLEARRENALNYGADYVVDPTVGNLEEEINKLTDGRGPSVVIECSGNDKGIASLFDIAGHDCRVGLVGHSIGRKVPVELGKVIWKTLHIAGSGGTKTWFPKTIRFMSQIKDKYDFAALNTHHYDFKDLDKAMDMAVHHKDIARKVMLTFED
ncbi:zinc-dependent alcohol dehydrogenase [Anaerotalea alkaliphila]|uniref:Alcohol dehydrogenase catalytic domain-containing protein n=1 Tax=Anaerotalea alkaliphila TaxID=2662126 RepID=A0A7X5HXC7_9FIRM|nr:alcohol dehydrogenase catalytic domain-containing protein [Anaerotalea alkaliphila]NDL68377.1 alcohol dehydrogenase catalytic domain-containing protein [Anaerotalea alkaliphila]